MNYRDGGTYYDNYCGEKEAPNIREALLIERNIEKTIEMTMHYIEQCMKYELSIQRNMDYLLNCMTPETIEETNWWISGYIKKDDLEDEYVLNRRTCGALLIEAKLYLQEIENHQRGINNIYITTFPNGKVKEEYLRILLEMNKLKIINTLITRQLESGDLE